MTTALAPSIAGPVRVEQTVDQAADTYVAELIIDPRTLLPELARALTGHAAHLLTLRTRQPGDMVWHDALSAICRDPRVSSALVITLSPAQAQEIGHALIEASEPRECDDCGRLNDLTSGPLCGACVERGDHADALISGRTR